MKTENKEDLRTLPSGYHGVAFENETAQPPPDVPCEEIGDMQEKAEATSAPASAFCHIPFLQKLSFGKAGGLFGSLLSNTEDALLLGLFLLLLLSGEGDPLCAVAILIIFLSDKINIFG